MSGEQTVFKGKGVRGTDGVQEEKVLGEQMVFRGKGVRGTDDVQGKRC